mmetsp:Transcript_49302/g.145599  ORF Transcript_49302/g.145599 Transcript_49302/m.145599 type:complete len:214 (-) Transcript_49302:148-789(-)
MDSSQTHPEHPRHRPRPCGTSPRRSSRSPRAWLRPRSRRSSGPPSRKGSELSSSRTSTCSRTGVMRVPASSGSIPPGRSSWCHRPSSWGTRRTSSQRAGGTSARRTATHTRLTPGPSSPTSWRSVRPGSRTQISTAGTRAWRRTAAKRSTSRTCPRTTTLPRPRRAKRRSSWSSWAPPAWAGCRPCPPAPDSAAPTRRGASESTDALPGCTGV